MNSNFDRNYNVTENKSKRTLNIIFWLVIICLACFIIFGDNGISFLHISGGNLKNLRYQETEKTDTEGSGYEQYNTINDLEEFLGIRFMLLSYLPDDYSLKYVKYSDITNSVSITFSSEENKEADIKEIIEHIEEGKQIFVEKDDTPVYSLTHNNTEFSVFGNNGYTVIEWDFDGYTYILSGVIDENEVKKIVNNIG